MAPIFILLILLAGSIFGTGIVESKLLSQISNLVGSGVTDYIADIIDRANNTGGATFVPALVGAITLVFGATGVFRELSYSLDKIWATSPDKEPRRMKGIRQMISSIRKHIPILLLIIILALLFGASIISSVSLQVVGDYMETIHPNTYGLINILEPLASFIFIALFFGVIYRVLPKTKLPWTEIAFGASVTAVIFLIGELLIGYYLANFLGRSIFGAAGSLITIMLWVYISAQVFFLGASFTFVYSKRYGHLKKIQ